MEFDWDNKKQAANIAAHGVDFETAKLAFSDPRRIFLTDKKHSGAETRVFCLGLAEGRILTVRFVLRAGAIRIIGAGAWREGKKLYEKQNSKN